MDAALCVSGALERSAEELAAFQATRLRDLVRHAVRHVPLYKEKYGDEGIDPESIHSVEDLHRLPYLTREELQRAAGGECLAEGLDKENLKHLRTSGSSGAPLSVWRDAWEEKVLLALRYRKLCAAGLPLAGRMANLRSLIDGVNYRPARLTPIKAHAVDCRQPAEAILERLLELRPEAIGGNSGSVAEVARLMGPAEQRQLAVRVIIAGGESATDGIRRDIERGFGVPLQNFYGCFESRLIALEMHGRPEMTVNEAGVLVEVIDGDRPVLEGETGEVVITALHSFAMPVIRYRLSDIAVRGTDGVAGPAAAGSLWQVQGRMREMFQLPSGRRLHPYAFGNQLSSKAAWVRMFRFIQEAAGRYTLEVVPWWGATPGEAEFAQVRRWMTRLAGEPITLDIRLVGEIRPEVSGKYRTYGGPAVRL